MTSRKSLKRKVSNILSKSESFLDTVREVEEDAPEDQEEHPEAVPQSPIKMLSPSRSSDPASRLQRLSTFLQIPHLRVDSKLHKDNTLRKPLPRKQLPAQYEQPPPSTAPTRLHNSAPAPPLHNPNFQSSIPPPSPAPTNRSYQAGSPPPALRTSQPQPADSYAYKTGRPRPNSLVPPSPMTDFGHTRVVSSPVNSMPISYHSEGEGEGKGASKLRRMSWVPGVMGGNRRTRKKSQGQDNAPLAWVNAGNGKIDYNLNILLQGEKVPELWNDYADTYVYLFPQDSNGGPSFKVPSKIFSSSQPLLSRLYGQLYSGREHHTRGSLSPEDAMHNLAIQSVQTPPYTPDVSYHTRSEGSGESLRSPESPPSTENHLYFPLNIHSQGDEVQRLVDVRNLFAFFMGQPLVATRTNPSQFRIFLSISSMLKTFQFTNFDGSTFGESAVLSFEQYCEELQLADVRESREATIEGLILGEAMRSVTLYSEAFAHAVGKYLAVKGFSEDLFDQISSMTRLRLENSSRQLNTRIDAANEHLTDFDFPSLFSGIANSTTLEEGKTVRFAKWKVNYFSFRKHVLSFYKGVHGQWPPKASSKKNSFSLSGLNRLVLRGLYSDFCDLYDYLVDRTAITTRAYDAPDQEASNVTPAAAALRKLLDEFDRSSPPVKPPIPFDVPLIPTIASVDPYFPTMSPKDQNKAITRKLKDHESTLVLTKSHNLDANIKTEFMQSFIAFEEKEASGKNVQELSEMRLGHWVLLYAVIQSLPLLAEDAPGLHFTNGVEYFLCQPTMGKLPWIEDAPAVSMGWYEVSGGGGVVSLPDDVVSHGVEATFRRSHCWNIASKWIGQDPDPYFDDSMRGPAFSPLSPPTGFAEFADGEMGLRQSARARQRADSPSRPGSGSRHSSGQNRNSKRDSIALGLERLPFSGSGPSPVNSRPGTRSGSPIVYAAGPRTGSRGGDTPVNCGTNTGATFDDILSGMVQDKGGKEKKEGKKLKKFFGGDGASE